METENAIEVRNIEKFFKTYTDKSNTLKTKLLFSKRNQHQNKKILKGISFDIKRGEAVGLLGKNGSGKSTTLKLLTKILRPNAGSIKINGRVSSLIELGAGFHPDMTGRENVYINASIFGIKAKEVDRRMEDIIRFSELEEYIDSPVRTYSSGMYMRLAFSIAINVDADILLIDEILAVGDSAFQAKCFQKLKDIKRQGTTIVIVSHTLEQIQKICDRAIWLEDGRIKRDGNAKEICKEYAEAMNRSRKERANRESQEIRGDQPIDLKDASVALLNASCRDLTPMCGPDARREGNMKIRFNKIVMLNEKGEETLEFQTGEDITIHMYYESEMEGLPANFIIGITRNDWIYCYGTSTRSSFGTCIPVRKEGHVQIVLNHFSVQAGIYFLDVRIKDENKEIYDNIYSLIEFTVIRQGGTDSGIFANAHQWTC